MAQLQTLLQLGAVTLPEIVKGRLGFIQLTQESERERVYLFMFRDNTSISASIHPLLYLWTVAKFSSSS